MNWLHQNIEITEEVIPEEAVGFIYMITHIPTGKYYIGKKSLESVRNVKIGVRELARIKEERKLAGIRGSLLKKKKVIGKKTTIINYPTTSKKNTKT